MVLARDHARKGLGHRSVHVGKLWDRHRDQAAGVDHLLGHEDVLSQMPLQCVTHSDLADRGRAVEVALSMIDRCVVDGGLHDEATAGEVNVLQFVTDLDDGHRTLIAQDDRPTGGVPPVKERMIGSLLDQLDQRGADPSAVHSSEHLARTRSRCRDALDPKVLEAHAVEHEGTHLVRDL